jgi:hypothetical protein
MRSALPIVICALIYQRLDLLQGASVRRFVVRACGRDDRGVTRPRLSDHASMLPGRDRENERHHRLAARLIASNSTCGIGLCP